MRLFDTHAHLDDPQLAGQLEEVLQSSRDAGLVGITAIGTTVESSRACLEIAERFDGVWAAVGIHPNQCKETTDRDWHEIVSMAKSPKAVALGETGLDRYWDDCPIEIQKTWFDRHIEMSFATGLPLVVHMRECETDILETFARHVQSEQSQGQINGIMHSFSGELKTAQQCLEWGMHISFAGMVTFKNAANLREIAKVIPDDRLLIETDSPYLTPHPHRGKRPNQPHMVQHTATCVAEVRGTSLEALGELTTSNAERLFGIKSSLGDPNQTSDQ